MKLKNIAIIKRDRVTTETNTYLDVHNSISNDSWQQELTVRVFGIPIFKSNRKLDVDAIILDREGKPVGFKESK